jgi:two-component system response regulator FlrC
VVDDDLGVRKSLEGLLAVDFEVVSANGVEEAESALERGDFDVVLTDYEMPGVSGMSFLRELYGRRPEIMGILLTGHVDHPEVRKAERDDAVVRIITKPYDPERLIKWIENAVRLSRMRRAITKLNKAPTKPPT